VEVAIPEDAGSGWNERLERLERPFGAVLLPEAERAVQDHDREDRPPSSGIPDTNASAPAAQSSSAMRWVTWASLERDAAAPSRDLFALRAQARRGLEHIEAVLGAAERRMDRGRRKSDDLPLIHVSV
jgi:hypothetical protein